MIADTQSILEKRLLQLGLQLELQLGLQLGCNLTRNWDVLIDRERAPESLGSGALSIGRTFATTYIRLLRQVTMPPDTRAPRASLTAIIGALISELNVEIFVVAYSPSASRRIVAIFISPPSRCPR